MADQVRQEMTCGEYLDMQRSRLEGMAGPADEGSRDRAEDSLCRIYAVSYQMNFERKEPPSGKRRPAESEALDREKVERLAGDLKDRVQLFKGICDDPRKLEETVSCAREGSGLRFMEMVNEQFLSGRTREQAVHMEEQPAKAEVKGTGKAGDEPAAGPVL